MKHRFEARYAPRPITHLETWDHEGWRVKVYGIAASGSRPSPALVEAIKREAEARLPRPAVTAGRYGEAFLYAHQGGDGAGFASVNWWANENELYHFQYEAPADDPGRLRPVEATGGSSMCVWDIAVIAHERQAWIDHVLNNDAGPDLAAYAAATLNAEV
jgi:hypothetical protein